MTVPAFEDVEGMRIALSQAGTLPNSVLYNNPAGARQALGFTGSSILTPVGTIVPYAGSDSTTPAGWLFCGGQSVSTTTYSDLFKVIGYTYGGSGASFNVPDLRGRVLAGKDNMGGTTASRLTSGVSGITGTTLGAAGGSEALHQHTHTQDSHNHTQNAHSHEIRVNSFAGDRAVGLYNGGADGAYYSVNDSFSDQNRAWILYAAGVAATNQATTATNQNTGTGTSQNVQPTLVTNYIIKAVADTSGNIAVTLAGAAGGDLTGSYPNPTITNISNAPIHNSNTSLSFRTSNTERMSIDANGRMLLPYQPSFHVYGVPPVATSNNIIRLTTVEHNIGSHYNASNGRFTAPIAGRYFFGWYGLGNATSDVYRYYLRRNGVEWEDLHVRAPSGIAYTGYYRATTFSLNVNDYVEILFRSDSGNSTYAGGGNSYHSFHGYLVG